ncbi:MAG: glycosyltransferase [Candidatus Aenigmarchaeota archaeon]|nr:glycosyltransferase [Candidatus Aenigmarchaeota archaeon]
MKILVLGKYDPYVSVGGAEKYAKDQLDELSSFDNEIIAVFSSKSAKGYEKRISKNIRIIVLPKLFELLESPFTKPFYRFLMKGRPELVWMHLPNPFWELYMLFYLLIKGKHFKLVSTYHADAPHYTIVSKIADFLRMFWLFPLLKKHDMMISTSKEYAHHSFVLRYFLDKTVILPIKIREDELKIRPRRPKIKLGKNDRIVLFIGRLHGYKGVEYLIEAFANVLKKVNNAKLVIAGDGPLKNRLINLSRNLSIDSNVYFLGRVSNAEKVWLLKNSDLFVLPSINRGEAFGIAMIEAMYFSRPVISTRIKGSGVTFVNKDGVTGIVVEPMNAEQLSKAIIKLLSNGKQRNKLGRNAKKRALKLFIKKRKEKYFQNIVEIV